MDGRVEAPLQGAGQLNGRNHNSMYPTPGISDGAGEGALGFIEQRRLRGRGAVENDLFEHRKVFQITLSSQGRYSIERLRPFLIRASGKTHQQRFLEHLQVTVQVAI